MLPRFGKIRLGATCRRQLLLGLAALLLARPAGAVDRDRGVTQGPQVPGIPVFVDMDPIVLPVIEGQNVTRQIGILLTLELAKDRTADSIEASRRQLTDAFISELYRIYGWRSGADRVVSEALIKRRLQATADHVLGPGVVQAILIRQLVEQQR